MSTARGFVRFPFLKHTVTENTEQLSFLYDLRVSVLFISDFERRLADAATYDRIKLAVHLNRKVRQLGVLPEVISYLSGVPATTITRGAQTAPRPHSPNPTEFFGILLNDGSRIVSSIDPARVSVAICGADGTAARRLAPYCCRS